MNIHLIDWAMHRSYYTSTSNSKEDIEALQKQRLGSSSMGTAVCNGFLMDGKSSLKGLHGSQKNTKKTTLGKTEDDGKIEANLTTNRAQSSKDKDKQDTDHTR